MRLVGPREAVPEIRRERVRSTVRDVWLDEVRRRTRRRTVLRMAGTLAVAAVLILTAGLTYWEGVTSTTAPPGADVWVATVERVTSASSAFFVDQPLSQGDEVTTPAQEQLALRLASGPALRLDAGTRLRLDAPTALTLETGTVYVDSGPSATPIEIHTPFGVARDVGTQFEVRVTGESLRLRVREGKVLLERDGTAEPADAGVELTVDSAGGVSRDSVAPFGQAWGWILRTAPAWELEGRTLEEILEWVARETGLGLSYSPAAEPRRGDEFHGSNPGLRPDQVPDLVLPTYGLKPLRQGGILRIVSI